MTILLKVENLFAGYGTKEVLRDVCLDVKAGEIVALLGHNGAGKTTTLRAIFGLLPVTKGTILFDAGEITNHDPRRNIHDGMTLMPQGLGLFPDFTVSKNLQLGGFTLGRKELLSDRLDQIYKLFPVLAERRSQLAGTLSGGERQMAALGMAVMTTPKLLLLDEPSTGLSPALVESLMAYIRDINQHLNVSILLVEQNISEALSIAGRAYIMRMGQVVMEQEASSLVKRGQFWDLF